MSMTKKLIINRLKGMPVIDQELSRRIGSVTDVIINSSTGRVKAFLLRTLEGDEFVLSSGAFHISNGSVITKLSCLESPIGYQSNTEKELYARRQMAYILAVGDLVQPSIDKRVEQETLIKEVRAGNFHPSNGKQESLPIERVDHLNQDRYSILYLKGIYLLDQARSFATKYAVVLWFAITITLLSLMLWL
jgi:sporulation protein YlmC with PRC-barrel domain